MRVSLYADDITVFLSDEISAGHALNILQDFYKISGLKLNATQTDALWIGSNRFTQQKVCNFKCKLYPENIKSLGVNFSSTKSPKTWKIRYKK